MEHLKAIGVPALVALLVVLAAIPFLPKSVKEIVHETTGYGSVTSPDINSPYFSFGGVSLWGGRTDSLIQASTTVCAIQSPAATSSLISAGIRFALASSSAVVVDLAKSLTPAATTTKIGTTYTVAAGVPATIVASSTGSVAGDATIFGPNQWFVVKMDNGGGNTNNVPSGTCHAIWEAF